MWLKWHVWLILHSLKIRNMTVGGCTCQKNTLCRWEWGRLLKDLAGSQMSVYCRQCLLWNKSQEATIRMRFESNCSKFKCLICGSHIGHNRYQGAKAHNPLIFLMEGWHQTHTLNTLEPFTLFPLWQSTSKTLWSTVPKLRLWLCHQWRVNTLKPSRYSLPDSCFLVQEKKRIRKSSEAPQCLLIKKHFMQGFYVQLLHTRNSFRGKQSFFTWRAVIGREDWCGSLLPGGRTCPWALCPYSDSHRSLEKTHLGLFILE